MLSRRGLLQSIAAACAARAEEPHPDYTIEIAPYALEYAHNKFVNTVAYGGQVPGKLLRLRAGKPVTVEVKNSTRNEEIVHWHGLFIPPDVDGAMEEGTPMIAPGTLTRIRFTPQPPGFRWYHTHTFAGRNLRKGTYTGQHGFLYIEPGSSPGDYDAEFFFALYDWRGQLLASDDGSMMPGYDVSTINGRVLGFSEPLRVKQGQRAMFHILNSSPTEVHWIGFAGHGWNVVAIDGNTLAEAKRVSMLRLAPAERVSAVVEMNNPGVWVLGEVRKHIQRAGMGVAIKYAGKTGKPQWQQPEHLDFDYRSFGPAVPKSADAIEIPLVFESKFTGHGDVDHWTINGKSYPETDVIKLRDGNKYRLLLKNKSLDDHPIHLHRHVFRLLDSGLLKDTVLVPANDEMAVEFTANNPGKTLFHCHQQDHMDAGFMMLFDYV